MAPVSCLRLATLALLAAAALAQPGCTCRNSAPPPLPTPPVEPQKTPDVAPPTPQTGTTPAQSADGALLAPNDHGRLYRVNGCRVLELTGTPEEMGTAHGQLLGTEVRRVLGEVLRPESDDDRFRRIMAGTKVMEKFQPEPYRRELAALARAAGVDYMQLVALQLFGDAERGRLPAGESAPGQKELSYQCTSFAAFGPATRTGELIAGRNFDYWYERVNSFAALIIHYRPAAGRSFITVSWSGVLNGWTLMNDAGLVAANNNGYGASESLEGVSTCFLQRRVIEEAATVEEGLAVVRRGPRAVGTVLLIAGGQPADAVEVEFDHDSVAVRRAENGWVAAANGFRALGLAKPLGPDDDLTGRYGALARAIRDSHGKIDRATILINAPGVPIETINLHSAVLFPAERVIAVSMGRVPACKQTYRRLRMTAQGIESAEDAAPQKQ